MRLQFLRSHAWQVSVGRFVVLLATALIIGLPLHVELYTVLLALFGYSLWSLVSLVPDAILAALAALASAAGGSWRVV